MITPSHILRLMQRPRLSGALKLGPEDKDCIALSNDLRTLVIRGEFRGVWFHIANEVGFDPKTRKAPLRYILSKARGQITGVPDYAFLRPSLALLIEMKSKSGQLNDGQKDFRAWCDDQHVLYLVCRSREQALAALTEHGFIQET